MQSETKLRGYWATRDRVNCVAIAAAGFMLPLAASIAEAQAVPEGGLEEVIVTAQFRQQSAQDTPLALTAISADMLEARSMTSVADVTAQAPNVTLKPAAGPFGPTLQAFIRGVGQYDFNYALEPGVGMYIDDVYFSTITGSNFDLLDLERIEVLRGPQGTLAGQNSIGGAVKLYSQKPTGEDSANVSVTYGSFNRTDVRGSAETTLIEDKLFARIAGVSRNVEGYVTRYDYGCAHPGSGVPSRVISETCKLGTEGGKSYNAARLSLRWLPTDKLEVNVNGDYTADSSEASPLTLIYVGSLGTPGFADAGPGINPFRPGGARTFRGLTTNNQDPATTGSIPMGTATGSAFISYTPFKSYQAQDTFSRSPYINYSDYTQPSPISGRATDASQAANGFSVPAINEVDSYGVSGTVDYEINDEMNIKSITAYRYYSGAWSVDEDATPIATGTLHNVVWHRQFSEELRFNAELFDSVNMTIGGLYFEQKSHYGGRVNLEPAGLDFLENDFIPGETRAAFANFDWQITDKLGLIVGGRYTEQEKTFIFGRLGVPGALITAGPPPGLAGHNTVAALNGLSQTYEGEEFDYRGAVNYKWTEDFMTYAQVSTGFKGGGINPRPFFVAQAQPFDSETLKAYEVGFKSDLFGGSMRLNGAVFLNEYEDIILTVNRCPPTHQGPGGTGITPCAAPINAGTADVKGGELETELSLFDGFSMDASVSYLDFEYTQLSVLATQSGLTKDMTTPFAPKWKFAAGAQYEVPLGSAGTLTPRLDWSYQAAFHSQPVNSTTNRVPNYYVVNGRISWASDDGAWNVALEGTNLLDDLYYLTFFDNQTSTQNVFGQPAPPRQWAVTLKRSF
jgi:iron complex outermembrane recepter protein